jgi:hypothetical protein
MTDLFSALDGKGKRYVLPPEEVTVVRAGTPDGEILGYIWTPKAEQPPGCPFDFSHTKHWCGYEECRDG